MKGLSGPSAHHRMRQQNHGMNRRTKSLSPERNMEGSHHHLLRDLSKAWRDHVPTVRASTNHKKGALVSPRVRRHVPSTKNALGPWTRMQKTPRRRPRALCHQQPKTTCGHWYPQERTRRRGKCYTLGMSDPAQPERTSQSTLQNGRKEWASSARKFSIPRYSRPSLAQNSAESGCRLTLSLQRR